MPKLTQSLHRLKILLLLLVVQHGLYAQYTVVIDNLDVQSGQSHTEETYLEIEAEQSVHIRSGGDATFTSRRIVLSPGFTAHEGSTFLATHNDLDFDGIPSSWEISHSLSTTFASGFYDLDGDGIMINIEFFADLSPHVADDLEGISWPANPDFTNLLNAETNNGTNGDLAIIIPDQGIFVINNQVDSAEMRRVD